MRAISTVLVTTLLAGLAGATALGQAERIRNNDSRRQNTLPSVSRTGSVPRPVANSPTVNRGPGAIPTTGGRINPGGGSVFNRPTVDRRPYCPRPTEIYSGARYLDDINFRNWDRGFWFLTDLRYRYGGVFNSRYSLWRMATGVSPLTPETLRLSTREARSQSRDLLELTDEIDTLIDDYENSRISARSFRDEIEERTDRIRKYAKEIRKDRLIDYVDVRKDQKASKAPRATSLDGLRDLSSALRHLALQLHDSLGEYADGNLAQVVSLNHLEGPSVDTLSKGIDSLAKTIEQSADKL